MRPTVVITGASGFIGGYLTSYLSTRGYDVVALVHASSVEKHPGVAYRLYDLSEPIAEADLANCDCVVHCAYRRSLGSAQADRVNIEGTRSLYRAAQKAGVKRFIYLSSLSAHEEATSHYGRVKSKIESMLDLTTDLVLRPGLVIGDGGLFRDIASHIGRWRVIPLVGGGKKVQCVSIDDLARCIEVAVTKGVAGAYALAAKDPVTVRELYSLVSLKLGKRARVVPVPIWLVDIGLLFLRAVHLPTPVDRDSLLGLKHSRTWDVERAPAVFGLEPKSCQKAIEDMDWVLAPSSRTG